MSIRRPEFVEIDHNPRPLKRAREEGSLPPEILTLIFSWLEAAKDFYSCLQVCRSWRDNLDKTPSFRFFKFSPALAIFYPELSIQRREAASKKEPLAQLLDRGDRIRKLMQLKPVLRLQQFGQVFLERMTGKQDLSEGRVLCSVRNGSTQHKLKWLDLKSLQLEDFPLQDFLSGANQRIQKAIVTAITSGTLVQASCLEDRYLVFRKSTNEFFVLDRIARRVAMLHNSHYQTSPYLIWNDSLIYRLKKAPSREAHQNHLVRDLTLQLSPHLF